MSFFRRLVSFIDGSAPTQSGAILSIQKYVRYVVKNRPDETVVTLLKDKVPGTPYFIWEADLRSFVEQIREADRVGTKDLDPFYRKMKARVEPDAEDWEELNRILNQLDEIIDWEKLED